MQLRRYVSPFGDRVDEVGIPELPHVELDQAGRLHLPDGTWVEPRLFEHMSPAGTKYFCGYRPIESALDDYSYLLDVFFIQEGCLCRGMLEQGGAGRFQMRIVVNERCVEGLVLVLAEEA